MFLCGLSGTAAVTSHESNCSKYKTSCYHTTIQHSGSVRMLVVTFFTGVALFKTQTPRMSCSVSSFSSSAPGNVLNRTSLYSRPWATEKHFLCADHTKDAVSVCVGVSTTD